MSILARMHRNALFKQPAAAVLVLLLFSQVGLALDIRIMPLGDSITVGNNSGARPLPDNDSNYWISYRKDLYDRLVAAGYFINYVGSQSSGNEVFRDPQHEGHPGWEADGDPSESILDALNGFLTAPSGNPDIVLLHIGTNDISSGQDPLAVKNEIESILNAIDAYEQNTDKDVWVLLALIVNRATGCLYASQTISLNSLLSSMVNTRRLSRDKILAVDMEGIDNFNYGSRVNGVPNGDMYDCIHPYATGYEKMADEWLQGLLAILPTANAGLDKSVNPGASVSLDGRGSSDSLGTITTYSWAQTAGSPTVALNDASTSVATFTAPSISGGTTLTFRLTITDDKGFSHNDECKVVVNGPPIAVAGNDQVVNPKAAVTLDGTASADPGGAIASYQWVQTAGSPVVSLAGASTAEASFTAPEAGTGGVDLVFTLTVTDNKGAIAEDVSVVHVNGPPVADAGPDQQATSAATVILDGTGSSDGDGPISKYSWVQISGPPVALSSSSAAQPSFAAPAASNSSFSLAFQLTVTDNLDRQSTDSVTVTVVPPGAQSASGGSGGGGGGGGCFITAAGM